MKENDTNSLKGIEHLGIVVPDSGAMAVWYEKYCDFEILKSEPIENGHVAFIRCRITGLIFELISNKNIESLGNLLNQPLQYHLAMRSEDIEADKLRLLEGGAEFVTGCPTGDPEARVLIVKDPWGNHIQLAQRKKKFY